MNLQLSAKSAEHIFVLMRELAQNDHYRSWRHEENMEGDLFCGVGSILDVVLLARLATHRSYLLSGDSDDFFPPEGREELLIRCCLHQSARFVIGKEHLRGLCKINPDNPNSGYQALLVRAKITSRLFYQINLYSLDLPGQPERVLALRGCDREASGHDEENKLRELEHPEALSRQQCGTCRVYSENESHELLVRLPHHEEKKGLENCLRQAEQLLLKSEEVVWG